MDAVSLAPSATATLRALGAGDRLVATTDHCPGSAESVGGWLSPDLEQVAALDPDTVLTADPLQSELRDRLRARGFEVVHTEPRTLGDVYDAVETLAGAVGEPERGVRLATHMRERVDAVRDAVPDERPVVYCEEWPDPPMAAGNWVPDAVRAAGGSYPFLDPGERSREVSGEAVVDAAPEHAVLHYCGEGDDSEPEQFRERWEIDPETHVFHDDLLNQPSPKLVEGIEALAAAIHGIETPERSVREELHQDRRR